MNRPRMFIAHETLETWVTQGRAELDAQMLLDRETGHRFRLAEGVRFLEELTGLPDSRELVGKVKDLDALAAMGGEHMADSVILGDNAYRVQPGMVGTLVEAVAPKQPQDAPPRRVSRPDNKAESQTIVALQKFFLNNVK